MKKLLDGNVNYNLSCARFVYDRCESYSSELSSRILIRLGVYIEEKIFSIDLNVFKSIYFESIRFLSLLFIIWKFKY